MTALLKNNPAALSEMIRRLIAPALIRYGEISALSYAQEAGRIDLTLLLKGEKEPVRVVLEGCGVARTASGFAVTASRARCSRLWLQTLLGDHPDWLSFPLSAEAAAIAASLFPPKGST